VARALAAEVGRGGCVVALDLSPDTVAAASARHDDSAVTYVAGDVAALDLRDAEFDGIRSERVLQHVAAPDAAIAELVRVTRPGGRVCLIDTDWESLAFDGMPDDVTTRVIGHVGRHLMRDHGRSMGRTLRRRLVRAGLVDISATPVVLQFTDPASAAVVLPMVNRDVPAEADMIPAALVDEWFDAVDAAARRGDFLAVLTIWVVAGTRPAPVR
jgi:ubiquinone/menaquinone biosynthesis C-methylase UbiE